VSVSSPDIAFALDLFSTLGDITSRRMMGGLTIYQRGQIFSLVGQTGEIYLKATGPLAEQLRLSGARQFSAVSKSGKIQRMGYWTLPEAALDDPALACEWAIKALEQLT